jgi:hypothetical protein
MGWSAMTHSAEAAGCRGVFAVSLVTLLLILATLAVMGPYQLVLAEWEMTRFSVANPPDS